MGSDFSLKALFNREESNGLLGALSTIVSAPYSSALSKKEWEPIHEEKVQTVRGEEKINAWGIKGLKTHLTDRTYLLSLAVRIEQNLLHEENLEMFSEGFGSMYAEVNAGGDYLLLTIESANTEMNNILLESRAIHILWQEFAIISNAIVAYIDCASSSAKCIYPTSKEIQLPDIRELDLLFDNEEVCIDYWGRKLIEINGL